MPFRQLTREQEQQFARSLQAGDEGARDRLFESQQAWALRLAQRCHHATGLERDDLRQVALMALWRCLPKFDPDRNRRLSTYVARVVNCALAHEVRRQSRQSRGSRAESREPETCGFAASGPALDSRPSTLDPLQALIAREQRDRLDQAIRQLPPRQRNIIMFRLQGQTQVQTGNLLPRPITGTRVQQLEQQALARLRELLEDS